MVTIRENYLIGLVIGLRCVWWEAHCANSFVVDVQAKVDALVQRLNGLGTRVGISNLLRLNESANMIDSGVNNTIADRFRDNVLGFSGGIKSELCADVCKRNARVSEVDLAKACLDDVVPQSGNECQGLVRSKEVLICGDHPLEVGQAAHINRL